MYKRQGDGLYGLPIYISIQCLGGNKAMLEEAGVDWKSVQENGWTYEEFREAIKAGSTDDHYGFIFACAGVTAADYLNIMVKNAGMPAPFDEDLKFAYTSQNFLELLKCLREIIDDGSTPKEMSSVDAVSYTHLWPKRPEALCADTARNTNQIPGQSRSCSADRA